MQKVPRWPTGAGEVEGAAARVAPLAAIFADTTPESEPNDTPAQANAMGFGRMISGSIGVAADEDYFAFDAPADKVLEFEVFASRAGSSLDPVIVLYGSDGTTMLAYNDDAVGLDSRLRFRTTAAGRYFLRIVDFGGSGSSNHWYSISAALAEPPPPGPGDPATVRVAGLTRAWSLAAAANGTTYILEQETGRIQASSLNGQSPTLLGAYPGAYAMALDGHGDLLVTFPDEGVIRRISTSTGQQSIFAAGLGQPLAIGIARDTRVWVHESGPGSLRRFHPSGRTADAPIPLGGLFPYHIAFSPAGQLHFTAGDAVFRLSGTTVSRVIAVADEVLAGIAFDVNGFLYVGAAFEQGVLLYDPQYQRIGQSFATDVDAVSTLAFSRSATGATTARLFAINWGFRDASRAGTIVELNPAGIRAPGLRVGADLLAISPTQVRAGVMGAPYADTLRMAGSATATWTRESGALPPGLSLNAATGVISGIPQRTGTDSAVIGAQSSAGYGYRTVSIAVTAPSVTVAAAAMQLLGESGSLTPDLERYLDLQGNRNGRFDLGDLRAYVNSHPGSMITLPDDIRSLLAGEAK